MKSLCAIQNPEEVSGLGASYRPLPIEVQSPEQAAYDAAFSAGASSAAPSTVVTQSPEELLAVQRRYAFISTLRPGPDYGAGSNKRNARFALDSGLGLDLFQTIAESVRKSAPAAFSGVKGSEIFGRVNLPAWVPRITVPKEIQKAAAAAKAVADKARADVEAKRRAEEAAQSVADQTSGNPKSPPQTSINPWVLAGGALLLIGTGVYLMPSGKRRSRRRR